MYHCVVPNTNHAEVCSFGVNVLMNLSLCSKFMLEVLTYRQIQQPVVSSTNDWTKFISLRSECSVITILVSTMDNYELTGT